ncbi:MAG: T9SS type A sorting domain-containing protein [Chitinophagaceae bacterium]|nr:MAG: T9SS type A sorting domain-containing protein [Chitinophagaceae bacterium]
MKNLTRNTCVLLCALVCSFFSNFVYSQQSLSQINGWNAYVHLPASYGSNSNSYPTIIFFPGLGEVGTNANALIANGPGAYIAQGWNGNVVVDGNTVEFIVISIQPPSAYPGETAINDKIQKIKSLYRVDNNRLYLTGLSHGGWCSTTFVTGDAYGGPYNYASQVAAVVEVEGVMPDDNAPYPNLFDNFAKSGGRLLGFEQVYDNRGMPTRINRMNATKANSGIYVQTNFGGGGHCCWNQFYGGQGTQPGNFMLDGVNQNMYQWLARQSRAGVAAPPANAAPLANAGSDKSIVLPTSSVALTGSGSDADGSIASYQWSKVSGNGGSIASPAAATTNITGLTQGSYTFQLRVTDNLGATATDDVIVTVNGAANTAPTVNAGPDQTIELPASNVNLNGAASDADGSISSYQWTKVSGGAATIASPASAATTVTGLTQGSYTFQLKVTDNAGATATDNIVINVNATTIASLPAGCNSNAPVTHYLTQTGPGEIYRPNGSTWKGGDTVKITGTYYSVIEFYNIAGDPCRPIVIMPSTTVTTPVFRIKGNSRYLKIWGGKTAYGIKVNGGPIALTSCHHIEVDNVEATGGSTGVYCKQDVVYSDPMTWNPNYRMTKFTFKNMWIHDIQGEGMYVGITQPSGLTVRSTWSGLDTVIVPIRLDSVEISNNIVERCQWDAIQLSNAREGNKIFGNTVRDYGTINMSSQQAGIILGGNTNGDIYNNTITRGTGNGIEAFGYGVINIYGNTLDSCGYDGRTNANGTQGQQPIYASDFLNSVEVNPKQTINAYNNVINRPLNSGGIIITGYYNNSLPSSVYGNTFCIPNAPANWQNTYLKLYVAGTTSSNNTLSCGGAVPPANAAPTANAGSDIVLTLPAVSATLNGSGTDSDGSIVSYSWTKISGPAASIVSLNAASTLINGLVEGVYTFELKVTDNGGLIGRDTVRVTVNALLNLLPAVNPANTVNGLDYKYYEGSWSVLPNFGALTAVKTGTVNNFDLTVANRMDQIGLSFTGYINVPADGVYTFYTTSDDGSKLLIDNVLVVDNDGLHGAQEKSGTIGLKAGKHAINGQFFEQGGGEIFTVSYSASGISKQQIPAASLYRVSVANAAPVANAGTNQNISTSSVNLSGSGTDSDGSIVSYSWTKTAGPDGISFSNANAAATAVTGLSQGTYQFQLRVTDNAGASATAAVQVVVTLAQTGGGKIVRVNVFGGTNPSTDTKWNNWNISAGVNTANLLYEDRTTSTIRASLAGDVMVVDNGTNYATGATTPSAPVLRYNSASTSQRDLTLKGLDPSKTYTIEFYASRKSNGNKTLYMIGNRKDTINTDNNVNDFAQFADVRSDASGNVSINISRIGTWNYLAGFSIIEQGAQVTAKGAEPIAAVQPATPQVYQGEDIVEMGANSVSVYPNPFADAFKVQLNNRTAGEFILKLTSQSGQAVFYKKVNKGAGPVVETINVSNLSAGTYILQIISVATGNATVHKVIKN